MTWAVLLVLAVLLVVFGAGGLGTPALEAAEEVFDGRLLCSETFRL